MELHNHSGNSKVISITGYDLLISNRQASLLAMSQRITFTICHYYNNDDLDQELLFVVAVIFCKQSLYEARLTWYFLCIPGWF